MRGGKVRGGGRRATHRLGGRGKERWGEGREGGVERKKEEGGGGGGMKGAGEEGGGRRGGSNKEGGVGMGRDKEGKGRKRVGLEGKGGWVGKESPHKKLIMGEGGGRRWGALRKPGDLLKAKGTKERVRNTATGEKSKTKKRVGGVKKSLVFNFPQVKQEGSVWKHTGETMGLQPT